MVRLLLLLAVSFSCLAQEARESTQSPAAPTPLSLKGKTNYYLRSLVSYGGIGRVALFATIDDRADRNYLESLGDRMAERVTGATIQYGIGAIRGEDPRFRPSGRQGIWNRTKFVLSRAFIADMDSGGTSMAAGKLLGAFGGSSIAAHWHPLHPNPLRHGVTNGAIVLAGDAGIRALKEFWPDIRRRMKRNQ
jgi:hypothetical protein